MLEDGFWPDCDFCGDTGVLPILMTPNQGVGNNEGGFRKGGEAPCPMCNEEEGPCHVCGELTPFKEDTWMEAEGEVWTCADHSNGLKRMIREQMGKIFHHTYQNGVCPDEVSGFVTRDVKCPACRFMMKLERIPEVLELMKEEYDNQNTM